MPIADPSPSFTYVTYCCGYCGNALNLRSSERNAADIDSKYGKAIKKGVFSFSVIDDSRFSHVEELICRPFLSFDSSSCRLFRRRTRLLCRKCGGFVGFGCEKGKSIKCYDIRIRALQPYSSSTDL